MIFLINEKGKKFKVEWNEKFDSILNLLDEKLKTIAKDLIVNGKSKAELDNYDFKRLSLFLYGVHLITKKNFIVANKFKCKIYGFINEKVAVFHKYGEAFGTNIRMGMDYKAEKVFCGVFRDSLKTLQKQVRWLRF